MYGDKVVHLELEISSLKVFLEGFILYEYKRKEIFS